MKRLAVLCLSALLTISFALAAHADDGAATESRWMRYPAISPDGKTIAFSYQGDLWRVPVTGGRAVQITTHADHERSPVWSPDSKSIAFASDRHGDFDVFLMSAEGGSAQRLTYHSASDEPTGFSPDGQRILFTSNRLDAPQATVGNARLGELYSIAISGGPPRQELTTPAEAARYNHDGSVIAYYDHKGFENEWRKHHQSPITRDLWLYDTKTKQHTQLTTFAGEDRDPVWAPDSKNNPSLFYLSEKSGSFNIWALDLKFPQNPTQITSHDTHPVRFLTIANDATLCYGYHGEIYIKPAGAKPSRVSITLISDERTNAAEMKTYKEGATEIAISPKEDEVAFVMRGDIFVTSVDHSTTRRITETPHQERSISFSPDGRSIYYASERDGSWGIYCTELSRKDEDRFFNSTIAQEKPVLVGEGEMFQPMLSPDGKQIAFLYNRDEIRVLTLATKEVKTIVPAARNYSYRDGDISFDWSPDSAWLSFNYYAQRRWINEIGVAEIATGKIVNMSESGYIEASPKFSRDGKSLLYYSNRFGQKSHGGWGSDGDVFIQYLNREAYDRAMLSPEDFDRLKKKEDEKKRIEAGKTKKEPEQDKDKQEDDGEDKKDIDEKDDKKEDDKKVDDADAKKPVPVIKVEIEFEDREYRLRRGTLSSSGIGDYVMSVDGEAIVYFAKVERKWDLWVNRPRDGETRKLISYGDDSAGDIILSKTGKYLFIRRGNGRIERIDLGTTLNRAKDRSSSAPKIDAITYSAQLLVSSPEERAYIFEHMWRQAQQKFYDPKLHSVDWLAYKKAYAPMLSTINNNYDFAEMMSELLGELNASHTGCYYRPSGRDGDSTAALGLMYDMNHTGPGLLIAEIIARGPADKADSKLAAGVLITHIDGNELTAATNPWPLLNRKTDVAVRLTLKDAAGKSWEEIIKPISLGTESGLLYERWIKQRRAFVEKISDGRVGYVHVRSMSDSSFRRTFEDTIGLNSDKEALVVDTRYNGGGWLHDDLVGFLGGRDYVWFMPRGKNKGDLGAEPQHRWSRPVVVVQSESNYSDAHFFPFAFKTLGLGKLVGAPVAGTATAVWWETQIDPSLNFGIPQVGIVTADGKYLENMTLDPDVLVYNDPNNMSKGEDAQLRKSVEVLLEQIKTKK